MLTIPRRPRFAGARRLAATLYAYSFLDDLVLLYPVYALLFADVGLSEWQIASLFIIWSATGIVLEVPSGAWADAYSRRVLVCAGPLLSAAGFALWVLVPSYWAFALGFVLWGVKGAMASGALEALVYEELDRHGDAASYGRILGRAHTAGVVAVMLATALAAPVLATGGYLAVGIASVVACLCTAAVAVRFPEHRDRAGRVDDENGEGSDLGFRDTLRAGLTEAHRDRAVLAALLLLPAVAAIWGSLEEFSPLLVRDTGVAASTVPLLVLLIWVGVSAGGLAAGRGSRLTSRGLGVLLALAAVAMAAGGAVRHPGGILLVALAFGAFQVASVVADVRLQERITGPSRATVTSVASLLTDLSTIGVYALYAAAATWAGHGIAFALFAVPYLLVAALLAAPRRPGRSRGRPGRSGGRSGGGERGGAGVAGQAPVDRRAAGQ